MRRQRRAACAPRYYEPVCGTNGHTYGNACDAGCANVTVAHNGECGIAGDSCGTLFGLSCQDDYKCRFGVSEFTYPFPDAGGTCVARELLRCAGRLQRLVAPAVLGAWQCNQNACAWVAGRSGRAVTDGHFETRTRTRTARACGSSSTCRPKRRRCASRVAFKTEAKYDKLEVWTWKNNDWVLKATFTGSTGPALTQEFPGSITTCTSSLIRQ